MKLQGGKKELLLLLDELEIENMFNDLIHQWTGGQGGSVSITGLVNAGWGLFLASVFNRLHKSILVVTPTSKDAYVLAGDTKFFLSRLPNGMIPNITNNKSMTDELPRLVNQVQVFPSWDTLPFEDISPGYEPVSSRIATLYQLVENQYPVVVIAPVESIIQVTFCPALLDEYSSTIQVSQEMDLESFKELLVTIGYRSVNRVEDPGEFATRGGILDIFSPIYQQPIRLELFGDIISSIRSFDPVTQRSQQNVSKFTLVPAKEFLVKREHFKSCISKIRSRQDQLGLDNTPLADEIVENLGITSAFEGIERWYPYLLRERSNILEFLDKDGLVGILDPDNVEVNQKEFLETADFEYRKGVETGVPLPKVNEMFMTQKVLKELVSQRKVLCMEDFMPDQELEDDDNVYRVPARTVPSYVGKLPGLCKDILDGIKNNGNYLLCCHGKDQVEDLEKQLMALETEKMVHGDTSAPANVSMENGKGNIEIVIGDISGGFILSELNLTVISAVEMFGEKRLRRHKPRKISSETFSSLGDLKIGDYIVHVHHGIGRYLGIKLIKVDNVEKDFLALEYADGDKLYVPIDRLNLVQRYLSREQYKPTLDKLGGKNWDRVKQKIKKSIRDMAEELLKIYAKRKLIQGYKYSPDNPWQRQFEAGFEYVETEDQLVAIQAVKSNMESGVLMDRLICGDVGFGKTEVALRASFKAINDGKQVAVLVPTTVLAHQHYENFKKRFELFPVVVEMLSRFRKPREQKKVVEGLRSGTVDLVIGTHRLLSKDVEFKDLGLLIIDEEHRFGVAQKEKIKKMKTRVDILAMTATPIPRTLHMSLMGIRDISLVTTPPKDRLSIHTQVLKYDPKLVREVILREMNRGGQVYFVHNRVQSIAAIAEHLSQWVPEAKIAVAHGQMPETQLEKIMIQFMNKQYDVLLCTAIIESGLDIPNVNTIIINRADKFGLAQLYQLRGRVGRDRYQAYAYLLVPDKKSLTKVAKRRLMAIQELTELGAGFRLATLDMDIRGAGNLLGAEQHGHIKTIGFDMYCHLLEETVRELKGEPIEPEWDPNINLPVNAFIPKTYISDINQRLMVYRKISSIKSSQDQQDLNAELIDRFGPIPGSTMNLLSIMSIKQLCKTTRIESLDMNRDTLVILFRNDARFQPDRFMEYLSKKSPRLYATSANKFCYRVGEAKKQKLLDRVLEILKDFEAMKE